MDFQPPFLGGSPRWQGFCSQVDFNPFGGGGRRDGRGLCVFPLGLKPHWKDTHHPLRRRGLLDTPGAHGVSGRGVVGTTESALVRTLRTFFGAGRGWCRRCGGVAIVMCNSGGRSSLSISHMVNTNIYFASHPRPEAGHSGYITPAFLGSQRPALGGNQIWLPDSSRLGGPHVGKVVTVHDLTPHPCLQGLEASMSDRHICAYQEVVWCTGEVLEPTAWSKALEKCAHLKEHVDNYAATVSPSPEGGGGCSSS